ncbi:hypothetical protein LMG27952_01203 [Paraburkholderia hiiakae]|uniref:Uncharacterized protein n=1 Tax=Paraburkholderia hiiakae TaxID=1081782 RepID=A0ABM8NE82_9BURK|nr:hypothetical protein LMG27952_01203 [Paraburkholderia hiiakae]
MKGTLEKSPVTGSNIRKEGVRHQCPQPDAGRTWIEQCVHEYADLPEEGMRSPLWDRPGQQVENISDRHY